MNVLRRHFVFLLFYLSLTIYTSSDVSAQKCQYYQTVDLTNQKRFENGSYQYHDMVIDKAKVTVYNYVISKRTVEQVEPHVRGCVCNNPPYCIRMCCERDEYLNLTSYACKPLPGDYEHPLMRFPNRYIPIFDWFVYQVGLPCKYPEVSGKWTLMKNGFLYIDKYDEYFDPSLYCLTPSRKIYNTDLFMAMFCSPFNELSSWLLTLRNYSMEISVVFLVPTVMVYLFLKDLRGNIKGNILISYLICLIVSYSILSFFVKFFFELSSCKGLGFTAYYFFMASFLWLSVLSYDIWINFKEHSIENFPRKNRKLFIYYSFYVWGTAGLLTCVSVWAQLSDTVPDEFKPGVGYDFCWINMWSRWSAAIYLYFPNSIILIFSMLTFGHLTLKIYRVRRDLANITKKETFFQEDALIMGLFYPLEILSFFLRNYEEYDFLHTLAHFRYAIQGFMLFVLFVFKRNVFHAIRKCFSRNTTTIPNQQFTKSTSHFGQTDP